MNVCNQRNTLCSPCISVTVKIICRYVTVCTAVHVCWRNTQPRTSVTYTDAAGSRVFWNISLLLANYKTDILYKTNLLSLISLWKRPHKTPGLAVSCLRRQRHTEGSGIRVSEFNPLLSFHSLGHQYLIKLPFIRTVQSHFGNTNFQWLRFRPFL